MKRWRFSLVLTLVGASTLCWLASVGSAAETVVYSEGFEANNAGFTYYDGSSPAWQWGPPRADVVGPKAAHSGANCWGTNLATGGIPRPCDGSILSPVIQLPTLDGAQIIRVRFWAYLDIDGMYDRGEFFVSKDGTNWESKLRMYNTMGLTADEPPAWHKYECTLDPSYSGSTLYLRFRAAVPYSSPTFYCGGTGTLSGLFIDDIAVSVLDTSGPQKLFSMRAWEDDSEWASCPWVAPWNGTDFVSDNDIYSVARQAGNEYTDYYRLMKPLVARDGVYPIVVRETEQEESYTDLAGLLLVDHAPGVAVAPDDRGGLLAYREASLVSPLTATGSGGEDVLASLLAADGSGYAAYSGDAVIVDFGDLGTAGGATLVLGATGFVPGAGADRQYTGPPAVVVETENAEGQWQERGRLCPRFMYSVAAFDLSSYLESGTALRVRLRSISHSIKYHLIDYVALQPGPSPTFTATQVAPTSAVFGASDILGKVATADGDYFEMSAGEEFLLSFPVLQLAAGDVRDFVFVSKGYYVPKGGSYLVYTWDGTGWVLRDLQTYPRSLATHDFDLSLFLPDPNGEYRVRVWQDYQWDGAGVDYVRMSVGTQSVPLATAYDYHNRMDIRSLVLAADGIENGWGACPRDRVMDFFFSPPPCLNTPPVTCPVTATSSSMPEICWAYFDQDGNAQASAEVQIWTGPLQTGTIVWNPAVFTGTATCATYSGSPLPPGTYYVGVRAQDTIESECGGAWGPWCWTTFTVSEVPPVTCEGAPARVADYTEVLDRKWPGEWIAFKVAPPLDLPCYASDALLGTFKLNDALPAAGAYTAKDEDWGQIVYIVKFKRADIEAMFPGGGTQTIKITGMCEGLDPQMSTSLTQVKAPACVPTPFCGTTSIVLVRTLVQTPTAGETLTAGSETEITWSTQAGQQVDEAAIRYSLDSGENWTTVAEHHTGSNSVNWQVPSVTADGVVVAVVTYVNGTLAGADVSSTFRIYNGTADVNANLPNRVYLAAPQPSPFASRTALRYGLPRAGTVTLRVLDVSGRRVRTLVNGMRGPGNQYVEWNGLDDQGRRVEPGMYLYRLEGLGTVLSQKVVYLR
jgi:hypothetical protein